TCALPILTFMETKWMHPKLVSVRGGRIGSRAANIIETQLQEQEYNFYLDAETQLPARVLVRTPTEHGSWEEDYALGDYRLASGLMLPHEIRHKDPVVRFTLTLEYMLNADYDESVFQRPPSIKD